MSGIDIVTEGGGSTININHTVAGIPVSVNLAGGTGTVNVAASTGNLDNIQGNVSVTGDYNSSDILNVEDQNALYQDTYTLTSSTVSRTGSAPISYTSMGQVNLDGGTAQDSLLGGDTYNIESTASGTAFRVVGGGDQNDTFNVSPTAKNLDTIQGSLTVWGHVQTSSVSDTLNIYDQNYSAGDHILAHVLDDLA